MAFVDLEGRRQFSPAHHVHASLTGTSWSDIGTACGCASPARRDSIVV